MRERISSGRAARSILILALSFAPWGISGTALTEETALPLVDKYPLEMPRGPVGWTRSVAFSADGTRIVTGSEDYTAIVWDEKTARKLGALGRLNESDVAAVAISADGRYVATGSPQGEVVVWDAETRKRRRTLAWHVGSISGLAFRNNGSELLSASDDGSAVLWDIASGAKRELLNTAAPIRGAALSPDGVLAATDEADGTVTLWDLTSGKQLHKWPPNRPETPQPDIEKQQGRLFWSGNFVAFSADGKRLVAALADKTAAIYRVDNGEKVQALIGHTELVTCVAFSADGKQVVTAAQGSLRNFSLPNKALVWDAQTGKDIRSIKFWQSEPVGISPDGAQIAIEHASSPENRRGPLLLDTANGTMLRRLQSQLSHAPDSISSDGTQMTFDGPSSGSEGSATRWVADFTNANPKFHRLANDYAPAKPRNFYYPNGGQAGFEPIEVERGSGPSELILSNTGTPKIERTLMTASAGGVTSPIVFSPDAKLLAIAAYEKSNGRESGRRVLLFDVQSGKRLRAFPGEIGGDEIVVFSPDGTTLAISQFEQGSPGVALWNTATGQRTGLPLENLGRVRAIWFSADSKLIAGAVYDSVIYWDLATRERRLTLMFLDTPGDWFAVARDGSFDGSEGALQTITVRMGQGMNIVSVRQAAPRFYHPGLLREILFGKPSK